MNKAPQPITGPPSATHPAPSPGIQQATFPPGQPPSVVFATPPPQMNPAPQHRQPYYSRPSLPSNAPRVPPSSTPRPVAPTHVYQPGQQMMMIPSQQIPFPNQQGPAYFIPGQYRSTYVATPQQYPVPPGTPGFYPGTSPAEYGTYAGAYYPAQQQYTSSVPAAPVIMNPPPQQQQPPPQQQIHPKRERKQIIIRDPNQGGRDITEEIMSGGTRSGTTPTPPQVSDDSSEVSYRTLVTNHHPFTHLYLPYHPVIGSLSKTPELVKTYPAPTEVKLPDTNSKSPSLSQDLPTPPSVTTTHHTTVPTTPQPSTSPIADMMDAPAAAPAPSAPEVPAYPAPLPEPRPTPAAEEHPSATKEEREEVKIKEEVAEARQEVTTSSKPEPSLAPVITPSSNTNGISATQPPPAKEEEPAALSINMPTPQAAEPPPESPIAQPEELRLPNGLPLPSPQDPEKMSAESSECDVSPIAEPEVAQLQSEAPMPKLMPVAVTATPAPVVKATPAPVVKATPAPVAQATPAPVAQATPAPVAQATPAPVAQATPAPVAQATPAPVSQATPALTIYPNSTNLNPEHYTDENSHKCDSAIIPCSSPSELCRPIDPEEKKRYDRDFLLGFQFISAAMSKPEGLPQISDVVLDKANKAPLRQLDPSRLPGMNMGPDFTPSFANLGRPGMGGGGGGPRRSQQGQRKEPRRIINISSSLTEDVKLNKAEKAWKPAVKKATSGQAAPEEESDDSEQAKTQELFKRVRSILNKLTPQMFQQLMKQVTELTIDTEERLKGVIDLIFEKAISEPNFSVAYANMCRCLIGLKVPTTDKPGVTVNFRKLLLNRCQKEFEKDKDDDVIFEKKQKELDAAATVREEKDRLKAELEEAKDKARRRSLGNIKFIGELFKLKMLTEAIMHDCIVKLLKNHDEESLECLCRLLSTIGKDLDFEKAKPRMDQYFAQMDKIIKEKKTSSRIRFMLQDVLDLRRNTWVPRRGEQGPKTIDQIHKDAELEEHREVLKVQQQLLNQNTRGGVGGRGGGGRDQGSRGGQHPQTGQRSQPQDEGWNTVPISTKSRPIDTSRLSKITKPGALDFNNQLLAPQLGGKGMWGSWGKGSSGGTTGAKPAGEARGRPATSTLNRFSALQPQQPSSSGPSHDSDRRVPQRNSSSRDRGSDRFERHDRGSNDRFDRRDDRRDDRDRNRPPVTKRSFSRETEEHSREREHRSPADPVRRVASMTDDRSSRDRARSKDNVKSEAALTPPPAQNKPALSEEMLEKKSTAIIEEYLHINDMKEALQCVVEMNSTPLLFVFVRSGLESTLERSPIVRERMGLLLHQLYKAGTLPKEQYYRGLQEILEVAEDMAIDVPHIWLYLAELITPMLHEGGIPMGQLFKEISKPLVPQGMAGVLLVQILTLLCKGMSHKKAGAMWREAGLSWKDFLPEDEDVNKFVTEKNVEFTLGGGDDETEKSRKKELSSEELNKQLDRLIQDKADNQRIYDWVEANLDETQMSSNMFVRAVMTSICQSAIICENPYKLDAKVITRRAKLLHKYLKDEQKELQALYALQALMVEMEQPANLLRMFFDTLYDEDVIKEEAFNKWESSKDPAEMQGKGVALKSVTAFFTWLREAEDEESDNNS
uniref:Eukaryotic translation initiation factor 4 gamma 1 n=1 Tax=Oncorhynchus mykiss TaxID=8022 RepID=A0A8C7UVK6_ONCMY